MGYSPLTSPPLGAPVAQSHTTAGEEDEVWLNFQVTKLKVIFLFFCFVLFCFVYFLPCHTRHAGS